MSAAALLDRLELVQRQGNGWRAKCPACAGRSRKLSISEADGGRVLVHCFGGCDALTVVQAVGLALADLFPEKINPDTPEDRRRMRRAAREAQWGTALDVLEYESRIIVLAARDALNGGQLNEADLTRATLALERIEAGRSVLRDALKWRPAKVKA